MHVVQTPEDLQWECRSLDTALEGEESKESCFSEMSSKRAIKNKELFDISKYYNFFNITIICRYNFHRQVIKIG